MKFLNFLLPKEILLDLTVLLISVFLIEIGSLCWESFWFLISILPNFLFFSFLCILLKTKFVIFPVFTFQEVTVELEKSS